MAKTNLKEQKKAERAKMTKEEKYEKLFEGFLIVALIFMLIIVALLFAKVSWRYVLIVSIPFAISAFLAIKFCLLSGKEEEKAKKEEFKRKKSLINKLNTTEFKEIKLAKSNNELFNIFLNCTIRARIDRENSEIIIVEICFVDNLNYSCIKSTPLTRDYILTNIEEVIE